MLYTLGLRDSVELDEMIKQFIEEENVDTPDDIGSYKYDDFWELNLNLSTQPIIINTIKNMMYGKINPTTPHICEIW